MPVIAAFAELAKQGTTQVVAAYGADSDLGRKRVATQQLIARSLNLSNWSAVLEAIETARGVVLAEWQRLLGPRDF